MLAEPIKTTFLSENRPPKCPPNPDFPRGIYVDATEGRQGCAVGLTYPAPCVGQWLIECAVCDNRVIVTAAGRPDDPYAAKIPCKLKGSA